MPRTIKMKTSYSALLAPCLILFLSPVLLACSETTGLCFTSNEGSFPLIHNGKPAAILLEADIDPAIREVNENFAEDLQRVSGQKPRVFKNVSKAKSPVVLIGTLDQSPLIKGLITEGKLDAEQIRGAWEAFQITVIKNPWPNVPEALVIAGSDRRGAVYGTYSLAEDMGVSPWHWFADVNVTVRKNIYILPGSRYDQPKVRYRGFFINDEDPAFSGWAQKKFGGINADMYAHVFELLLRMKGNYIWPAMWAPKSFHLDDPRNRVLADDMGVVMGTSHHEPLTMAQAEWHRMKKPYTGGAWNYETNDDNLRAFWRDGLQRMMAKGNGEHYENLLTVGMRGDGDEPMSEGTAIALLEKIVADQRKLIEDVSQQPAEKFPQVWALYKEVQDYYDQGMTVPEDITLLFADDNWGQIRRLPTKDLQRQGGYGVYYHFDYVGAPRNYKWLNTVQIEKVWQQMDLAYERGARALWVVNVGDIKPMEYPLDFFLKMAWNPEAMTPDALAKFPADWAQRWFGENQADDIAELITLYSQYAAFRKPELLNENTFTVGYRQKDALVRGEFSALVQRWRELVNKLESVKKGLPKEQQHAFFQTVEHPILALANLYELYFATAWNQELSRYHDARANYFLDAAQKAWERDLELTELYHAHNNRKWDGMMNQVHMNYVHWNTPVKQTMPTLVQVAADTPLEHRNKQPVFINPAQNENKTLEIAAVNFSKRHSNKHFSWTPIPNLGIDGSAVLALPQGKPATSVQDNVSVEYEFELDAATDLEIHFHLAPTLDTYGVKGIRFAVALDGGEISTLVSNLIPTAGAVKVPEQQDWVNAVIKNEHVVKTSFNNIARGKHNLKLWRLDDNLVLQKISVLSRLDENN